MMRGAPRDSGAVLALRLFLLALGLALMGYVFQQGFQPEDQYTLSKANHERGYPSSPDHTGAEVTVITTNKKVELYTRCWAPEGEAQALFLMVHGFTFHSQYFSELAQALLPYGIKSCTLDLTGHGRSGSQRDQRAFVESMQDWVDDVDLYAHYLHFMHPGLPMFAYGESLGGCLLLRLMCHSQGFHDVVQGYILSNPPIRVAHSMLPPKWLLPALNAVGRFLPMIPVLGSRVGGESWKEAFGDREFANMAYDDPLVELGTPRLGPMTSVLTMTTNNHERLEECTAPFLALSGLEDKRVDPQFVQELYERASSQDKTLRRYPNMRHQLLQETEANKAVVFKDIREWILQRVPAATLHMQNLGKPPVVVGDDKAAASRGGAGEEGVHTEL